MPEQDKNINDYYTGLLRTIEYFTRCWRNREGKFEVSVSDEKGKVEWSIKGGHTERSSRIKEKSGEEE